ncbi:MAG: hypothetical protein M3N53_03475 [Actinomycetota bacterium]|nr:hypothetical protein [Actinomycetota bacterium]
MNAADIPDGTIVRARLIGYSEKGGEVDVPDYEAEGVGPIVQGPLKTRQSILGHTSCFVNKWAVEEDSVELVEGQ